MTISVPTGRLVDLGLVPGRFFVHNESLEVLQAFRLAGEDVTLLVRIRRKVPGPSGGVVDGRAAELRERYGLKHFELIGVDDEALEYTVLLRITMMDGLGELFGGLGADVLPARPFTVEEDVTLVSFYATDSQLRTVRDLLDGLNLPFEVERSRRVSGREIGESRNLTERQRHLLQLAHRLGYFDSPAKTDLSRLAEIAGVSKTAVSKQLRSAVRKVLDDVFEGTGTPP